MPSPIIISLVLTILSADMTREPEQRYSDTTHRHTLATILDITIIHSLAILRQKHKIIRWENLYSQLNLNKCPIYVLTMNAIANLPPCHLIPIFTVCNGCDIIIFIYSICACLLLHPVTALHGIIRIGFERLDTKYVD